MLYRRLLLGLLALFVVAGLVAPTSGQDKKEDKKEEKKEGEKAKLEWKFKKGVPFYQTMKTKTDQTMNVMNNDVKQTQEQTFYFKWTPLEQKEKDWVIEQEIIAERFRAMREEQI